MPEKKLVFDTTVLSNFLIAGAASLLIERYHRRGIISWEVYDELSAGYKKEPALRRIERVLAQRHFELITMSAKEHSFFITLLDSLGKGEASCIALARYKRYTVVSDDRAARRHCDAHEIPYTGTIGILLAACRGGRLALDQADHLLQAMIEGGFYSPVRKISDIA